MNTTPGEWIVVPDNDSAVEGMFWHHVVAVGPDENQTIAICRNIADAALMSASQKTLDALIQIVDTLNQSKGPISIDEINLIASAAIEKIAAESGEL